MTVAKRSIQTVVALIFFGSYYSFAKPQDKIWKRNLKVVTIRQPPFVFPDQENNIGFVADLLGIMFKGDDITFQIRTVGHSIPSRPGDTEESSDWQAVIDEVTSGRADMIAAPLTITGPRMKILKFSFPFMPANVVLMVKKPRTPGEKLPFRHLKDLAKLSEENKLIYGVMQGGATEAMFKETGNKMYQEIYEQLIRKKSEGHNVLLDSYAAGLQQVRNSSNFAFIGDEVFLEYASTRPPCDTMIWGKPLNTAFYGLAFPRNVPQRFLDHVNQRLLRLQRFGKMRRLRDKWWENECEKTRFCICANHTQTCSSDID